MTVSAQEDRGEAPRPTGRTIVVTRHCPPEMRTRTHWAVDQFVCAKKLGGGYASTVHLAIDKATGVQVALKMYHRCKLSALNHYQVQREIRIHAALSHTAILELYAAFQDEAGVYLVTEYASKGDVFGELDRRGGSMTEADAVRQVMLPFLGALEYLHLLHIIHRDIKPENLLFTASGGLKVADFGLSIDITQERPVTRVGTLDYMAPEVVVCPDKCHPSDNKELTHLHYTFLVDSWAVGVLAYELTVGRAPFDGGNKQKTIEQILHAQPKYPSWISEPARHFITWCLTKDATKRPTIQQLAVHPWITGYQQVTKPKMSSLRAASFHDLKHYLRPGGAVQAEGSHHHSVKFGGMVAPGAEGEEQQQQNAAAVAKPSSSSPADSGTSSSSSASTVLAATSAANSPFAAVSEQVSSDATSAPAAGAGAGLPPVPGGAAVPPKPKPAAAAAGGFFGLVSPSAAAEKLRAFVTRCQSANNMDGLRAALANMPPEPSNSCFEPGGRFYTGPPRSPPAAAAGGSAEAVGVAGSQQQPQQQDPTAAAATTAGLQGPGLHDSSSSWSTHSCAAGAGEVASLGEGSPVKPAPAVVGNMPHSDSCKSLLECIKEEVPSAAAAAAAAAAALAAVETPQLGPVLTASNLACVTGRVDSGSPLTKSPGAGTTSSPVSVISQSSSQISSAGSSTVTFVSASGSSGSRTSGEDVKGRAAGGSSGSSVSCGSPWTPILTHQQHQQPLNSPMSPPQPPSPPSLASSAASNAFLSPRVGTEHTLGSDGVTGGMFRVVSAGSFTTKGGLSAASCDVNADSRSCATHTAGVTTGVTSGTSHQKLVTVEDPAATYLEDLPSNQSSLQGLQCFSFLRASPR